MACEDSIPGTIDVVIPMRNGAATILATLASVSAQTLTPRRIIIVDDGSTDGGSELVRDHPLVDILTTPPLGVAHARNVSIRASRAEFIAPIDCDDLWRADKLERQFAVARRYPDAAVITCDEIQVTPSGALVAYSLSRRRHEDQPLDTMLRSVLKVGGWSSSMLVRRSSLLEVGGYDETLTFFEDLDLCLRLARGRSFRACPEVLSMVVDNPLSVTRRPATPEQLLHRCLLGLAVIDRWIGEPATSRLLARQAARFILSKFVRCGLHPRRLRDLRREMLTRAPGLAARIARNDLHLALNMAAAGILGFGAALAPLRRHIHRQGAARRGYRLSAQPVADSSV